MANNMNPIASGAIAIFAGICMCKGLGAVLPRRLITDMYGDFTFIGGVIYWFGFIGTVSMVLNALGFKADRKPVD